MRNTVFTSFLLPFLGCGAPETKITRLTPDVTVAPEQIAFGEVVPGTVAEQTFHVVNAGRMTLEVSDLSLSDTTGVFAFEYEHPLDEEGNPADPISLAPSESVSVTATFTPEELIDYDTTLVVTSNDEEFPVLDVPLNGTGVIGPQPDIEIDIESIDFGDVVTGETATDYVLIKNIGDGPLNILQVRQEGSGAFAIITDPTGQEVNAGGTTSALITYSPDGGLSGHAGSITFLSDDPDEPEVTVNVSGGDGGPDATTYPNAIIMADDEVVPPERVELDGTRSNAGDHSEPNLRFAWSVVDKPAQSNALIEAETASIAYLDVDIAGSYIVQLIVTDADSGISSAPTRHTVNARPVEELYIALTWDKADTDLDLHVVPNAGLFWGAEDVSFCNPELDWDDRGVATFSGDVSEGFGPEAISITGMADTAYHIGVHYFEDNRGASVTASVTVYLNGEFHGTFTKDLNHNYFWKAGYVQIEDGEGSIVENDDIPYFSSTRECSE